MRHQNIQETYRAISPKQHSTTPLPTIAVSTSGSGNDFANSLSQAAQEITQLRQAYQAHADLIAANTQALQKTGNTSANNGGSGGVGSTIEGIAQHVLGGGILGLFPLIGGIASLFGGGDSSPAPLPTYTPPPPISIDSTIRNGGLGGVAAVTGSIPVQAGAEDGKIMPAYSDIVPGINTPSVDPQNSRLTGLLAGDWLSNRSIGAPSMSEQLMSQASAGTAIPQDNRSNQTSPSGVQNSSGTPGTSTTFAPSVTVQVQAMDSQSFLDRSSDIANAVREAVLNLHPLTSVLADL